MMSFILGDSVRNKLVTRLRLPVNTDVFEKQLTDETFYPGISI